MKDLHYKGFTGSIEINLEATRSYQKVLTGKVSHTVIFVSYAGNNLKELTEGFKVSVDAYIDHCKEVGILQKDYSGKFIVRVLPEHHCNYAEWAKKRELSLNKWIAEALISEYHRQLERR